MKDNDFNYHGTERVFKSENKLKESKNREERN